MKVTVIQIVVGVLSKQSLKTQKRHWEDFELERESTPYWAEHC